MSDKQKALLSLALVLQSSNAALEAINPQPGSPNPQDILLKDLVSILSLLHAATTKVSLALKPSNPTYRASISPLKDLADHVSALFHCTNMFDPISHGSILVNEVVILVKDAITSIRALIQTFLDIESNDTRQSTGQAGDEYMVRTAAVHNVLDKARDLSTSNLLAVRKRWVEDAASIEDGFREVGDMVEEGDSTEVEDEEELFDDGWDEIGLGPGKKMNPEELARTKKVHGILRLSTLLHKRILTDVLSVPQDPHTNSTLDTLSSLSHTLLSASDELVSTLYTPQDPDHIATELTEFRRVVSDFQSSIIQPESLEAQLANLSLGKNGLKWFDTCFVQIYKAVDVLAASLHPK